ncbi:unnamed protein product [Bursaphelenchus xylophilus]|uniref:(pine wood nematode) hypothetical protein n=1 Tax=Bursaphelenchus xylophilus TaxID=6326 RepID=A0A1I7SQ60_BURXY|nr:unnamed protein product [Bursaphelenchus xylophilus]CAG9109639.1 unnamed protein product [Bursaphelenchus xylophilus]
MFRRFGHGNSTLWKAKNVFTVDYLKYIQGVLVKNEKVTESNKAILVEAVRMCTEILIWGDQNDSTIFDFFLEKQMFTHFVGVVRQSTSNYVNVQLLQTLNILFENIRNETALYYLLSNNHVNHILTHQFDFRNEEVLAYYVSFLKTLSFKLNPNTVHFFFNESTHEFPLFTEALKFYDHPESMARIAVRTLTLNTFRVDDPAMMKFVTSRAQDYFGKLAKVVAKQVIEMDTFARSALNETSNRDRLMSMIDNHLDNVHYINDVLMIQKEELNSLLINSIMYFVVGPLYMASLASLRDTSNTILLSKVSSLFLLNQLFLIIHSSDIVQSVLTSLFFGDENDVRSLWNRSVEKGLYLDLRNLTDEPEERVFFYAHLNALVEENDDHCTFYALLLIYNICQNRGVNKDTLEAAQIPLDKKSARCDPILASHLLKIIRKCVVKDTPLRSVTLDICCIVLRGLILALEEDDQFHKDIEATLDEVQEQLASKLREVDNEIFLEMFEEEHYRFETTTIKVNNLAQEPALYLPPTTSAGSNVVLSQRLPYGNDEKIRRSLQFYFILRKFSLDLRGLPEPILPLSSKVRTLAEINDCINLNNSDLLSCTVIQNNERHPRFLVTDQFQLILVEPDSRKLGWAVVCFAGLLQDTHVTGDQNDSRALHVVVEDVKSRIKPKSQPQFNAKLVFDDHIRCMAAKQRLGKGRKRSRLFKLNLISELFGGNTVDENKSIPVSPNPVNNHRVLCLAPGSVQAVPHSQSSNASLYSVDPQVPEDPLMSPKGSIKHL